MKQTLWVILLLVATTLLGFGARLFLRLPTIDHQHQQIDTVRHYPPAEDRKNHIQALLLTDSVGLGVLAATNFGMSPISVHLLDLLVTGLIDQFYRPHPYGQNTFNKPAMLASAYLTDFTRSAFLSEQPWSIFSQLAHSRQAAIQVRVIGRMGASYDPQASLEFTHVNGPFQLIIVHLGIMDLLLNYGVDAFDTQVNRLIAELIAKFPNASIFLNAIPDFEKLRKRPNQERNAFGLFGEHLPNIWQMGQLLYGGISPLTRLRGRAPADHFQALNQKLTDAVATANDGRPHQRLFLYHHGIVPAHVTHGAFAIDNLHPSLSTHRIFAEAIFNQINHKWQAN